MPPVDPVRPFGVAWRSDRLYRVTADFGTAGKTLKVDGWDDALDSAWRQLVARPGAISWMADYVASRGDEGLTVTFGDTGRVVGRRGYGNFDVSYPTDLLLAGEEKQAAMRRAVIVVLDRHVDRRKLGVPLLSVLVGAD